jgi:hypothetical protein
VPRWPAAAAGSVSGFADFAATRTQDTDFLSSTLGRDHQKTTAKTFSQELQAFSDTKGPLGYVAGVYLFKPASPT